MITKVLKTACFVISSILINRWALNMSSIVLQSFKFNLRVLSPQYIHYILCKNSDKKTAWSIQITEIRQRSNTIRIKPINYVQNNIPLSRRDHNTRALPIDVLIVCQRVTTGRAYALDRFGLAEMVRWHEPRFSKEKITTSVWKRR